MRLYRSGRVEALKQFCGVVPGDRTTRSFLDPLEVRKFYFKRLKCFKIIKMKQN